LDGRIVQRRQDAELTMGMFANVFRACLGGDWTPQEVHFEHLRPLEWREHEHAFDAPVHFGQRTNCVMFGDSNLDRRMPAGDLGRLTALRDRLTALAGNAGAAPFLDRVRAEVRSRLPEGYPHIEDVAQALDMARWTMQRRLAEHSVSFSDVIEGVRRDLAALYVRQRHIPLSDVADLLGYSEPSAFSRAFRRWFGAAPQSFRDR
jgi:AraC-like DNA-binding protein